MSQQPEESNSEIYHVNWYPSELPEKHEPVTVQITRVDEMGIWVKLLEYSSKEGMIPIGQFTQRKTHNVPKEIRIGKITVGLISQVDQTTGNMDLTRQGLKDNEITAQEKKFNEYKNLMNLLNYLSTRQELGCPALKYLTEKISYTLQEEYTSAYSAIQSSYKDPSIVNKLDIAQTIKDELLRQVQRMFKPQETRIHALFEAEVLTIQGVDALRDALVSGYQVDPENYPNLLISIVAPPQYSASVVVLGDEAGVIFLNKVLDTIRDKVLAAGGKFEIKESPKVISQKEQNAWQTQLDRQNEENDDDVEDGN